MKVSIDGGELDIFENEGDDEGMLNYAKSMAGHTIIIDSRFTLKETEYPNIYIITKKEEVKE